MVWYNVTVPVMLWVVEKGGNGIGMTAVLIIVVLVLLVTWSRRQAATWKRCSLGAMKGCRSWRSEEH